jgi:hypothetical protein
LWHPDKLEELRASILESPNVVAVDHEVWIFGEDERGPRSAWGLNVDFSAGTLDEAIRCAEIQGKPVNRFDYLQRFKNSYDKSLRRVFSTTSAICVRRDAFFKVGGFNPAHANGEDWALSTNLARLGEWQTIPRPLGFQRVLATSGTYDRAALVMILSTLANHWYSGRPLKGSTEGFEFLGELRKYGSEYRALAQGGFWNSLRRHDLTGAASVLWFSMLLLPRWQDRFYVLTPPQVTARVARRRRRA